MDTNFASAAGEIATALQIEGLRSEFAGPFDLELARGEVLCISGASGSGKSLFLRMVADLDVNEGSIILQGRRRSAMAGPAWRRLAPYVAAESSWWRERVIDHFGSGQHERASGLAARLGLGEVQFDAPVGQLSTGERQRLALVRALVLDSPVLLLDEPTGPLDPVSVLRVEDVLRERAAGGTIIVMTSHDLGQAKRLGTQSREMRDRRLGSPA